MIRYNQLRERRDAGPGWRSEPFRVSDVLFSQAARSDAAEARERETRWVRGRALRAQVIDHVLDAYLHHVDIIESEDALIQLLEATQDRLRRNSRPREWAASAGLFGHVHDPYAPRFRVNAQGQMERVVHDRPQVASEMAEEFLVQRQVLQVAVPPTAQTPSESPASPQPTE